MTVLRRLDAVLEPTQAGGSRYEDVSGTNQDQALRQVAGQAFYNTSQFTLRDAVKLMARLMCLLIAEEIESGTYLLYDGALVCGAAVFVSADARQCAAARRFGLEVAVL